MLLILPLFWLFPVHFRMQSSYLLYVCVMLGLSIIFHFRITRQIKFRFHWDFPLVKRSYNLGFKAFLSEYMAILMTRIDVLMLKQVGTFADLGIYMLAINFIDIINVTSNMIGVVLLNKFSALNDDRASLVILRKIFVLMIAFNIVCILGMAVLGPFVINFMYTGEYIGAYKAFMYLIPAIFGLTLGSLFNTFLWSKGFPIFTIIAPAEATTLKLALSNVHIPQLGYLGAAAASSIDYPLWLLMLVTWYFRVHKDQKLSSLLIRREDIRDLGTMLKALVQKVRG
jgi:O-antigen/teichoic acid export membrane protein